MTSIEACWTVRFGDPQAFNGGVIVLESGRLYGGDSGFAYLGHYDVIDGTISGSLRVVRHDDDWVSMYQDHQAEFSVNFNMNRVGEDVIQGILKREGFPDAVVILNRLAELP